MRRAAIATILAGVMILAIAPARAELSSPSPNPLTGVSIFGNMGARTNSLSENSVIQLANGSQSVPADKRCYAVVKTPVKQGECTVEQTVASLKKYQKNSGYVTGIPACIETAELPCIESISLILSNKEELKLEKKAELSESSSWPSVPEINLGKSYPTRTIWSLSIGGVEQKFLLRAAKQNIINLNVSPKDPKLTNYLNPTNALQINLIPFTTPDISEFPVWQNPPHNAYNSKPIQIRGRSCPVTSVWYDESSCSIQANFPKDSKVKVSLRLYPSQLGSMNGRIYRPSLNVSKVDKYYLLEANGSPMKVPGVYIDDLGKAFRFIQINGWSINSSIIRTLNSLRNFVGDTANTYRDEWNFALSSTFNFDLSSSQLSRVSQCYSFAISREPSVGTFMTTNAMMGQEGPPKFDGKNMSYKLSGLHKNPDGSNFSGYYQMIIDAKLARCIYNLKDRALQAKVSITDEGGGAQSAFTQTLKEDTKVGKIYFEVANFHFSDPTIKFQLSN